MRVCYAIARIGRGTNEPVSNWDEGCERGKNKREIVTRRAAALPSHVQVDARSLTARSSPSL